MIDRLTAAFEGRYKVKRKLGEGGMASVYLAEDVKHERNVALKILKPELAAVIGAERFLAEIKTTANLQHPHILPLFDSGEAEGFLYYVMPYIDGETLAQKLERERQLGVNEAVKLASAVADALDYAHRSDVLHRDIKPGNILLHDGRPVVADFGIALAISAAGGGRMTETGLSLGTPHYMSPEQASADRDLNARSDVYSLGCVLYEMLAGQPPHTGPSAQSILVRILTESPRPVTEMRHTVPPHVAAVVMKAIEKLPADRFESAGDFMAALEDESFTYTTQPRPGAPADAQRSGPGVAPGRARTWLAATAVISAVAAVAGWMAGDTRRPEAAAAPVTAFVLEEEYATYRSPAVASDGTIVYQEPVVARSRQLFVRAPGTVESVPLQGGVISGTTSSVAALSPDGAWLAFIHRRDRAVRRMPSNGGPITTLWTGGEDEPIGFPEWSDDGWIYFLTSFGLGRIPEAGGAADTVLAITDLSVRRIEALPGGRGVLFTRGAGAGESRVMLMDLSTRDTTTLIPDGFDAVYVDTGHLIYANAGGALYAIPFDLDRLEATGSGVPVIDDLATLGGEESRYDVSRNGTLVYARGPRSGAGDGGIPFGRMTPDGVVETYSLEPTDHFDGSLSADGRILAYTRSGEIWLYDTELGTNDPFSSGAGSPSHNPVWSPDGTEIAYGVQKEGDASEFVHVQKVDGSGEPRRIEGATGRPTQWLEDGTIIYHTSFGGQDVYSVSAAGDAEPVPLLRADWMERFPKVSPDGRWLAFVSGENGSAEVHLRRWPELTEKIEATKDVPVSPISQLVWSLDSQRLYFASGGVLGSGGTLWEITLSDGDSPEVTLRDTGVETGALAGNHPDGSLLHAQDGREVGGEAARLIVVTNWLTVLKQRLGEEN